jgi:hypothetical protein
MQPTDKKPVAGPLIERSFCRLPGTTALHYPRAATELVKSNSAISLSTINPVALKSLATSKYPLHGLPVFLVVKRRQTFAP